MLVDEEGDVRLRGDEANAMREVGETLVPRSRGLLEAVQRLVQATDVVGAVGVDEARRLLTLDLLVKIAMEEGILDVELVERPGARYREAEDDADRGRLDDGAECLVKVDPRLLREAANHPSRLVAGEAAIRVEFVLEDPFP